MKKLSAVMLTVVMVLALTVSVASAAEEETYSVGVIQLLEHPALDLATEGFVDALTELLGDAVTVEVQNAQGESSNCSMIANGFVSDNVDLIMANATPALQAAAAATGDIPIMFIPAYSKFENKADDDG